MGWRSPDDIIAYRLARELKLEVYRLVRASPSAARDFEFRDQLFDAVSSAEMNIAEGFRRFKHGDFKRFLRISLSSQEEAVRWIQDGIDRGHFTRLECERSLALGHEVIRTTTGIIRSLGGAD